MLDYIQMQYAAFEAWIEHRMPQKWRLVSLYLSTIFCNVLIAVLLYKTWLSYEAVALSIENNTWPNISFENYLNKISGINYIFGYFYNAGHIKPIEYELTSIDAILSIGGIGFTIIFSLICKIYKQQRWNNEIFLLSLVFLFGAFVILKFNAMSKIKSSIIEDKIYTEFEKYNEMGYEYSNVPVVFEIIVDKVSDYELLESLIASKTITNIFLSMQSLRALERIGKKDIFFQFIERQRKNKIGIKLFADIEFQYGDVSLLNQSGLSSFRSLPNIYNAVFVFANKMKYNYKIDYIFGPVLDRKLSISDQTINFRSFGQDIRTIYSASFATILAFHDAGIQCIPKHFPGYSQNVYRNSDSHFRINTTKYSPDGLKINALPFNFVHKKSPLFTSGFMTDHIIIPSISTGFTYGLHSSESSKKTGVNQAREAFSEISEDAIFVTDDMTMLLSGAVNDRTAIGHDSVIDIKTITNDGVVKLIEMQKNIFVKFNLDINNCSDVLSVLSDTALRSGNSFVLIRSQSVRSAERISKALIRILSSKDQAYDRAGFVRTFFEKSKYKSSYKQNDQITNVIPFLKLSYTAHVDKEKIRDIIDSDFFYFGSCIVRDDIGKAFKVDSEGSPLQKDGKYIYTDSFGEKHVSSIMKKVFNDLERNQKYSKYVFILSKDWQKPILEGVYEYLKSNGKLSSLYIFIAESPDYLFYLFQENIKNKEIKFIDAFSFLYNSNVFCIFDNKHVIYEMLSALYDNNSSFSEFSSINNSPFDLPNYFHNFYHENLFESDNIFDKLLSPSVYSSILGVRNEIYIFKNIAIAFIGMSIVFSLLGIIYSLFSFKEK